MQSLNVKRYSKISETQQSGPSTLLAGVRTVSLCFEDSVFKMQSYKVVLIFLLAFVYKHSIYAWQSLA